MSLKARVLHQLSAIGRGDGVLGRSRLGRVARTAAAVIRDGERWRNVSPGLRELDDTGLADLVVPSRTVASGPFAGMKYATDNPHGPLLPKLLGTYECELHDVLERVVESDYSTVIDVGCAEGYYATGLAMRCPNTRVIACDIDERARQLCLETARLNGVANRIDVHGEVDAAWLIREVTGHAGPGFVLSDCEGFEADLFTDEVARALAGWDLLIEVHDGVRPGVTGELTRIFSPTHDVTVIAGIGNAQRVARCAVPELEPFGFADREWLMQEGRETPQDWLWITSG